MLGRFVVKMTWTNRIELRRIDKRTWKVVIRTADDNEGSGWKRIPDEIKMETSADVWQVWILGAEACQCHELPRRPRRGTLQTSDGERDKKSIQSHREELSSPAQR